MGNIVNRCHVTSPTGQMRSRNVGQNQIRLTKPVIVVHGQFVEAEHDLQRGWDRAALVADQLIGAADGTEEPVCLLGEFRQGSARKSRTARRFSA
jgi:hypothetical protein